MRQAVRDIAAEAEGLLVVDKPAGRTSHDVVQAVKTAFGARKAGHLGTLDPMATGVLVVCIGQATKAARFVADHDKEYEGTMVPGAQTDTWDSEGEVIDRRDASHVTEFSVREVFADMIGEIKLPIPPFSAIKRGGEPLYRKARRGEEIEPIERSSRVDELELLSFESEWVRFRCVVSRGTYVRSIVYEAGIRLGTGAYLGSLRRTRSGIHRIGDSMPLAGIESNIGKDMIMDKLIPLRYALTDMPELLLEGDINVRVQNGGAVSVGDLQKGNIRLNGDGTAMLFKAIDPEGRLVAVMERSEKGKGAEKWKPVRVWKRENA